MWRGARLLAGAEVAEARSDEVTTREREFLAAAQERADAEQRDAERRAEVTASQNRRLRRLLGGLAVLLVLAVLAGLIAWRAQQEATAARASADAKRIAATSLTEDYLDLALLSAVEAVRSERSPETTGALLTLLARLPDVVTQVRSRDRFLGGSMSPDRRTCFSGRTSQCCRPLMRAREKCGGRPPCRDRWQAPRSHRTVNLSRLRCSPPGRQWWCCWTRTTVPRSRDSRPTTSTGLLTQVVWLPHGQLAVLATSGVVLVDPTGPRTYDSISWQQRPVPEDATMRPLGPDRLVVSTARSPLAVVDVDDRRARTVDVTGDVFAASPDGQWQRSPACRHPPLPMADPR